MPTVTVQLEGVPELKARAVELINRTRSPECKKIWMQAGLMLRDAMRYLAPIANGPITYYEKGKAPRIVQPGMLRAACFAAYGDPAKPNVLVGVNNTMAPHGKWIEFGTARTPAQPYMRPAFTQTAPDCIQAMADGYRRLLTGDGAVPTPQSPDGPVEPPTETTGNLRSTALGTRRR